MLPTIQKLLFQENKNRKDNLPYGEYGGWHKAAKVQI